MCAFPSRPYRKSTPPAAWFFTIVATCTPAAAQDATSAVVTIKSDGNPASGTVYRLYKSSGGGENDAEVKVGNDAVAGGSQVVSFTDNLTAGGVKPRYVVKWVEPAPSGKELVVASYADVDASIGDQTYYFTTKPAAVRVPISFDKPPVAGSRYRLYRFDSGSPNDAGAQVGAEFISNGTNGGVASPAWTDRVAAGSGLKPIYVVKFFDAARSAETIVYTYPLTDLSGDANPPHVPSIRPIRLQFVASSPSPSNVLRLYRRTSSADHAGTQVGADLAAAAGAAPQLGDVVSTTTNLIYEVRWANPPSPPISAGAPGGAAVAAEVVLATFANIDATKGDQTFSFTPPRPVTFKLGLTVSGSSYAVNVFLNGGAQPVGQVRFDPRLADPVQQNPGATFQTVAGDVWSLRNEAGEFDAYTTPAGDGPLETYVAHPAKKYITPATPAGPNPNFLFAEGMQIKLQTSGGGFIAWKDVEIRRGQRPVKLVTLAPAGQGQSTLIVRKGWSGRGYSFEIAESPGTYLAVRLQPAGSTSVDMFAGSLHASSVVVDSAPESKQAASFDVTPSPSGPGVVLGKQGEPDQLLWFDSLLIDIFRFKPAFNERIARTASLTPIVAGESAAKIVYQSRNAFGTSKAPQPPSVEFLRWQSEFQPDPGAKILASRTIAQAQNASFFDYGTAPDHMRQGYNLLFMDALNLQDHGTESAPAPFIFLPPDAKTDDSFYTDVQGGRMAKDLILSSETEAQTAKASQAYSTESEFQSSLSFSLGFDAHAGDPKSDSVNVSRSGGFSQNTKDAHSAGRIAEITTDWDAEFWLHLNKDTALLAPEFQNALIGLAGRTDYATYRAFFRRFGTHYSVSTLFGTISIEQSYISSSSALSSISRSVSLSAKQGATVDGIGGDTQGSTEFGSDALSNVETEDEQGRTVRVGEKGKPAPIKALLRPIYELAYPELFSATGSSQPTLLDAQNLAGTRSRLKEMLVRYLDQEADDLFYFDQTPVVVVVSVDSLACTYANDQYSAGSINYADDVFGTLEWSVASPDDGSELKADGTPYTAGSQVVPLWDDSANRDKYKEVDKGQTLSIGKTFNAPLIVDKRLVQQKDGDKIWFPSLDGRRLYLSSNIKDNDGAGGDQALQFDDGVLAVLDLGDLDTTGTKSFEFAMTGDDGSKFTLRVSAALKTMSNSAAVLDDLPQFPNVPSTFLRNPMPPDRGKLLFHDRYTLRHPDLYGNKPLALREWHYGKWELIDRASGTVLVTFAREKVDVDWKKGTRFDSQRPFKLTSDNGDLTVVRIEPTAMTVVSGAKASAGSTTGGRYPIWDADVVRYESNFTSLAPLQTSGAGYVQTQLDGAWVVRSRIDNNFRDYWFPAGGVDPRPGQAITLQSPGWSDDGSLVVRQWVIPASIPQGGMATQITRPGSAPYDYLWIDGRTAP